MTSCSFVRLSSAFLRFRMPQWASNTIQFHFGGGRERGGREKILSRVHAQHEAQLRARSDDPWHHDLSQNQESDTWSTEPPRCPWCSDFYILSCFLSMILMVSFLGDCKNSSLKLLCCMSIEYTLCARHLVGDGDTAVTKQMASPCRHWVYLLVHRPSLNPPVFVRYPYLCKVS